MSLLNILMDAQGGKSVDAIAGQFGLDKAQARSAVAALVPALTGGMKRNAGESGGMESLLGALAGGQHDRYLDEPQLAASPQATQEGNAILGHVFGSKDVSREVASRASAQSGVGADILKKMLPVVASMVMGGLSKQAGGGSPYTGGNDGGDLGSLVGGVLNSVMSGNGKSGGSKAADLLTSALDQDGDGSMIDDVLGSFFKR